jgi:hypothetical protein
MVLYSTVYVPLNRRNLFSSIAYTAEIRVFIHKTTKVSYLNCLSKVNINTNKCYPQ